MVDMLEAIGSPIAEGQKSGNLLLVTAVRLRRGPRGLQLDDQTSAGLCRWAESFHHISFAGIIQAQDMEDETSVTWLDVVDLPCSAQLTFVELPYAYQAGAFAKAYRRTRALLGAKIREADHLCFTLGYLFGDWGAIAALEAVSQGRRYAVWFDRVEHEVIINTLKSLRLRRRIKERMTIPVMIRYHHYLIRRSTLGLFQGRDTYNAYAPHASNPACMYDVHTQQSDRIGKTPLRDKIERILSGAPLRIAYAGRAASMKGPEDWVAALATAVKAGASIQAQWIGDGPLLEAMRTRIEDNGLTDKIRLTGYVSDRDTILSSMRDSDLFLFCHKTPESPRCLIEALVCGCPIAGYHSPYAADLIEQTGGGTLTAIHDAEALGRRIAALDANREELAGLVRDAAMTGERFDEQTLYRQRAELITKFA